MAVPILRRSLLVGTAATGAAAALSSIARRVLAADVPPPQPAPKGWLIGCYTRPWDQHDWTIALDQIAEAGYKYAGLMTTKAPARLVISAETTPEQAHRVGQEARKRGLAIPSVYGGDIPVQKSLEAAIEALRRLIDNCVAAGAANLMMGGIGKAELYDPYYKAIAECCPYAAEKGLGLSVKPHGGLNATGPQCRRAIEKVGHPNFRLWYDPGNIFYYSDGQIDPAADAATVDGLVVGMSVKDYVHPRNVTVTPGTGKVDFASVLGRLKQGGFSAGPLVVETLAPGDLPQLLAEARKARSFLEQLVARLD